MAEELVLDGKAMPMPLPPGACLADLIGALDRSMFKGGRRISAATCQGRNAFFPLASLVELGDFPEPPQLLSSPVPELLRKAVVTLNIGTACEEMFSVSSPTFEAYARKIGADYIVIDTEKIKMQHLFFEKWQIFSMLYEYDRVLYLDSDILISPDCPDLFSLVSPADVGALDEQLWEKRTCLITGIQELLGDVGWTKSYYNAGLGVFSWLHKPLFKKGGTPEGGLLAEQNLLNHRIAGLKYPVHSLPREFNRMDMTGEEGRLESFIIHYAGSGFTGQYPPDPKERLRLKTALMREDRKWFEENRSPQRACGA